MEWDTLCSEYHKASSKMAPFVDEVIEKIEKKEAPCKGPAVLDFKGIELEVSHSWLGASEKDIKAHTQLDKIPRAVLKTAPQILVPAEDGSGKLEDIFLFKDPSSHGLRQVKMKVLLQSGLQRELLAHDAHYWRDQAELHWQHAVQAASKGSGMASLRDSKLADFGEWCSSKFHDKEDASMFPGGIQEDVEQSNESVDDAEELGGIAASSVSSSLKRSLSHGDFTTPSSKASRKVAAGNAGNVEGSDIASAADFGAEGSHLRLVEGS
eukprot:6490998-Amphidinium_carterae.1